MRFPTYNTDSDLIDTRVKTNKISWCVLRPNLFPKDTKAWHSVMRPILYDQLNSAVAANKNDTNHDILGYVDKDIETQYMAYTEAFKSDAATDTQKLAQSRASITISNVDLYTNEFGKYTEEQGDN